MAGRVSTEVAFNYPRKRTRLQSPAHDVQGVPASGDTNKTTTSMVVYDHPHIRLCDVNSYVLVAIKESDERL